MGVVLFTMLVGSTLERADVRLTSDTPWDEPVLETSLEYRTYVEGNIWGYQPWCKLRGQIQGVFCAV